MARRGPFHFRTACRGGAGAGSSAGSASYPGVLRRHLERPWQLQIRTVAPSVTADLIPGAFAGTHF
jgi:hypothetical protein